MENLIMIIVWASVFIIALFVELGTDALVSIWFCIGALVAGSITYIPSMPWWGELIVFVGVSLLSFLVIRPLVNKKLQRIHSRTNVDAFIGKKAVVIKRITDLEKGEIKLDSMIWTAIKRDADATIEVGEVVKVISIQGNKMLVEKA